MARITGILITILVVVGLFAVVLPLRAIILVILLWALVVHCVGMAVKGTWWPWSDFLE